MVTIFDSQLYGICGTLATIALYLFNYLNFKNKREVLSNSSSIIVNIFLKKDNTSFFADSRLWIFLEITIISFVQHNLLGAFLHTELGRIFKTGANYYGTAFFKPIILFVLFYIIAVNPLKQMDLITPAFPLALVFIKLACFVNGCCTGFECSWGITNYYKAGPKKEFPTQLVEAGLALLIFLFLLWYRKRAKEGTLFPVYLILYSATRFFSEFTRYEDNIWGPLKTYHFFCIVGVIVGIAELLIVLKFSENIKLLYDRNPFPWIQEKNIVHRKSKKNVNNRRTPKAKVFQKDYSKFKMWAIIWTLGLIGQTSWNVEGTWFNTFVYEKIDKNPSIITPMLIMSALATTVSIFLFGTLTDRTGKRRNLISIGFILWGILTACFGLTQFIAKGSLGFAVICVVFIDMLLSFFGSMSTDVGYSTWLTDIMNEKNRGLIGGAIAIQCVLGSLLANVIGGFLIGKENNYIRLFVLLGGFMSVFGIISIFLFSQKDDVEPSVRGSFIKQFSEVLDFKSLIKQKELLLVYVVISVFFVGYNTYMPHLGNFLIQYLGFSADQLGIIEAVPLLLATLITLPVSKFINQGKFVGVSLFSVFSCFAGVL